MCRGKEIRLKQSFIFVVRARTQVFGTADTYTTAQQKSKTDKIKNKTKRNTIYWRKKWLHSELQVTFSKAEHWEYGPPSANINGLKCSSGCNKGNNTREESQEGRAGTPVPGTMGIWLPEIMGLNRAQHHCYCSWENGAPQARLHPGRLKTEDGGREGGSIKYTVWVAPHSMKWDEQNNGGRGSLSYVCPEQVIVNQNHCPA